MNPKSLRRPRRGALGAALLPLLAAGVIAAPGSAATPAPRPVAPPTIAGMPGLPGPVAGPATPAADMKIMKAVPDQGPIGTPFTVSSSGLPANADVDIVWYTVQARYVFNMVPDSVDFYGRQYDRVGVVIGKGRTDASGNLSVALKAPNDYGMLHDLYAVVNGVQVAKGGFFTKRTYSISPLKGPVGTWITIRITGLGQRSYENSESVSWDNRYVGFMYAQQGRGTTTVRIRAAGPVGKHTIDIDPASSATPFLNIDQSAIAYLGSHQATFTVTADNGPPDTSVVWPDKATPNETWRTTVMGDDAKGVAASFSPSSGPVLTKTQLTASGLAPGPVGLTWSTARGTRTGAGWNLTGVPMGTATVGADGKLSTGITVPDNVGGWNSLQLVQNGVVKASVPFYTEWSVAGVPPKKVKEGQTIEIHLKGLGYTDMDNIVAVNYDNAYVGYACGFFSLGDTVVRLTARGGPGTHIVDLYPTVYKQHSDDNWYGGTAFLSFQREYPLLALGYRIPSIHVAFEIVK